MLLGVVNRVAMEHILCCYGNNHLELESFPDCHSPNEQVLLLDVRCNMSDVPAKFLSICEYFSGICHVFVGFAG